VGRRPGRTRAPLPRVLAQEIRSSHDPDGRPPRVGTRPPPPGRPRPRLM